MNVYWLIIHSVDNEGVATNELVRFPFLRKIDAENAWIVLDAEVIPDMVYQLTHTIEYGRL